MKQKLKKIWHKSKRIVRIGIAVIAYVTISTVIVTVVALILKTILVYGDWLWSMI